MVDILKAIADATRSGTADKSAKGKDLFVLVSAKSFAHANPTMNADALTMIQEKNHSKIAVLLNEWTSHLKENASSNEFIMLIIKR